MTTPTSKVLPELPQKRRAFLCTKCGSHEVNEATRNDKNPGCINCGYLVFAHYCDYNDSEMQTYAIAAIEASQPEQGRSTNPVSRDEVLAGLRIMVHSGDVFTRTEMQSMGETLEQFQQSRAVIEASQTLTCVWTAQDDDMPDTYESACGRMWSFIDGGVAENNVRFCQGCGKAVEVCGIKGESK